MIVHMADPTSVSCNNSLLEEDSMSGTFLATAVRAVVPWSAGRRSGDPFLPFRRQMSRLFDDFFSGPMWPRDSR